MVSSPSDRGVHRWSMAPVRAVTVTGPPGGPAVRQPPSPLVISAGGRVQDPLYPSTQSSTSAGVQETVRPAWVRRHRPEAALAITPLPPGIHCWAADPSQACRMTADWPAAPASATHRPVAAATRVSAAPGAAPGRREKDWPAAAGSQVTTEAWPPGVPGSFRHRSAAHSGIWPAGKAAVFSGAEVTIRNLVLPVLPVAASVAVTVTREPPGEAGRVPVI